MTLHRMLGQRGRTTIPLPIRERLDLRAGDLLSFTLTEDTVVIRREKICDNCTPEKTIALDEFFDGLTPERQQALVSHLARKLMSRKGGVRFGRA